MEWRLIGGAIGLSERSGLGKCAESGDVLRERFELSKRSALEAD